MKTKIKVTPGILKGIIFGICVENREITIALFCFWWTIEINPKEEEKP